MPPLSAKGLWSGLHPQTALVLPAPLHVGKEQGDAVSRPGTMLWARHRLLGDPPSKPAGPTLLPRCLVSHRESSQGEASQSDPVPLGKKLRLRMLGSIFNAAQLVSECSSRQSLLAPVPHRPRRQCGRKGWTASVRACWARARLPAPEQSPCLQSCQTLFRLWLRL
ncbi:hypothetical protein GH733_011805 [Mirounga leonina]|nr:hypothetical protein GH733_011805 [Mirounga leonina]